METKKVSVTPREMRSILYLHKRFEMDSLRDPWCHVLIITQHPGAQLKENWTEVHMYSSEGNPRKCLGGFSKIYL